MGIVMQHQATIACDSTSEGRSSTLVGPRSLSHDDVDGYMPEEDING